MPSTEELKRLVERLRDQTSDEDSADLEAEAATTIEALQARVKGVERELAAGLALEDIGINNGQVFREMWTAQRVRAEDAERRLAEIFVIAEHAADTIPEHPTSDYQALCRIATLAKVTS
jgi:hypothetical protein